MDPLDVIGIDDKPVLDKLTNLPERRPDGAVPIRRTITYRDGHYDVYEYDQRNPPPTEGEAWGTKVATGINQQQATAWRGQQQDATKAGNQAPNTVSGGPAGTLVWVPPNAATGEPGHYAAIGGTAPHPPQGPQPTASPSGVFYRFNEATGQMEAVGMDPVQVARQQDADRRANDAENRAATTAQAKAEIDRLNLLKEAKQIDDAEAERQWQHWWKLNVEEPRTRAQLALQTAQEERTTATQVQNVTQQAGQNRVADIVASIPYRFSGNFLAGRQQMLDAGQRGMYGPATAVGPIQIPDLSAARAQAEQQGQSRASQLFGFDLPPAQDALAQVPHYTGPVDNPQLPTPEDMAAEELRRNGLVAGAVAGRRNLY